MNKSGGKHFENFFNRNCNEKHFPLISCNTIVCITAIKYAVAVVVVVVVLQMSSRSNCEQIFFFRNRPSVPGLIAHFIMESDFALLSNYDPLTNRLRKIVTMKAY